MQKFVTAARLVRRHGLRGVGQRVVRMMYHAMGVDTLGFPLAASDVTDGISAADLPVPSDSPPRGTALRIGWLSTPPGIGSGGHTTMFRMIAGLERAGHVCELVLYDPYGSDIRGKDAIIRRGWPWVRAGVRSAAEGLHGLDACVATSWQTAHVLASQAEPPVRRLYFIQDYEPFFYPRGAEYALAEETYRLGFRNIALGEMVSDVLKSEVGVSSDVVPFGCDTTVYHLQDARQARSGIVFYSKPDVPRRGYHLSRLALEIFHERHPEQEIHVFGHSPGDLTFPVTAHGRLNTAELNTLYNRTLTGLAISFTNISLVAEEMLAAGNIPVVNDSPFTRAVLSNEHTGWARPSPAAIADALCRVVEGDDPLRRAAAAAASVRGSWRATQEAVVEIIENEVYRDFDSSSR